VSKDLDEAGGGAPRLPRGKGSGVNSGEVHSGRMRSQGSTDVKSSGGIIDRAEGRGEKGMHGGMVGGSTGAKATLFDRKMRKENGMSWQRARYSRYSMDESIGSGSKGGGKRGVPRVQIRRYREIGVPEDVSGK
jgi:hypothetical protein